MAGYNAEVKAKQAKQSPFVAKWVRLSQSSQPETIECRLRRHTLLCAFKRCGFASVMEVRDRVLHARMELLKTAVLPKSLKEISDALGFSTQRTHDEVSLSDMATWDDVDRVRIRRTRLTSSADGYL